MKMMKKIFFPLFSALILAGCASNDHRVNIDPVMTQPNRDPSIQGITIGVTGIDARQDKALAKVNRDGQLDTLIPARDLRLLVQEIVEKQMTARGYKINPNSKVNLHVVVNRLFADVSEGNFRYSINTNADVSVIAQAQNGNKQVKNYRTTYNVQGAFTASDKNITNAINNAMSEVVSNMAQDTSISTFIKSN